MFFWFVDDMSKKKCIYKQCKGKTRTRICNLPREQSQIKKFVMFSFSPTMTTKYMNKYENMIWDCFAERHCMEEVVEKNNIFSCFTPESSDLKDEQIYNKKSNTKPKYSLLQYP